jgi:hypothetical protein
MNGVQVIDNTHGQVIDFDKELEAFPHRFGTFNNFASDKHMMSIQKLWDLLPDGFLLINLDIHTSYYTPHCLQRQEIVPEPAPATVTSPTA